jgi:hypothetical protein
MPDESQYPDLCPDCGAGRLSECMVQLPRGFPADQPCETCRRRGRERMEEAGRRMAYEREKAMIDAILGDEP